MTYQGENEKENQTQEQNDSLEWELDLNQDLPLQMINNLSFDQLKEIALKAQQTAEEANEIAAQKEAAAREAERAAQIAQRASADASQAKQSAAEITSKAELLLNKLREEEAKEIAQQAATLAQEKQGKLSQIEQELEQLKEKLALAQQEAEEAQKQAAAAQISPGNFWQEADRGEEQAEAGEPAREDIIAAEKAYAVAVSTSTIAEEAQKKADNLEQEYHANKKEQAALATEIEKWLAKEENAQSAMSKAQKNQEVLAKKIADRQFLPEEEEAITAERTDNFASITKEEIPIFNQKKSHPLRSFCIFLLLVVGTALAMKTFVIQIANISGESMYPTLHDNDKVLVSIIGYYLGEPEREDIVIISSPERFSEKYIKRIIALPGEHIVVSDNQVFVNDKLLEEDYLTDTYTNGSIDTIVPAESYFVMGDNRTKSSDSRSGSISFIKREEIVGKAFLIVYPKDNWKKLD